MLLFFWPSSLTVTQLIIVKVAGIRFSFNPSQDPGCRILENTVSIGDKPFDKNKVCICIYLGDSIMVITKCTHFHIHYTVPVTLQFKAFFSCLPLTLSAVFPITKQPSVSLKLVTGIPKSLLCFSHPLIPFPHNIAYNPHDGDSCVPLPLTRILFVSFWFFTSVKCHFSSLACFMSSFAYGFEQAGRILPFYLYICYILLTSSFHGHLKNKVLKYKIIYYRKTELKKHVLPEANFQASSTSLPE